MTTHGSMEKEMAHANGFVGLGIGIGLTVLFGIGIWQFATSFEGNGILVINPAVHMILSILVLTGGILVLSGLRAIRPQEAVVYTFFGKYYGTLRKEGFHFINPLATSFTPKVKEATSGNVVKSDLAELTAMFGNKAISLKTKTISNDKQKINDLIGNPIIVDTVVMWRITDTAKAVFDVDNYVEYLSSQCDAALRNTISMYPYDVPDNPEGKALRTSATEIADALKEEIQKKVTVAGIEIVEARITNMYYAPEIASAMLQRQQAKAILDAKTIIVEGAVDIVDMALTRLSDNNIVELDDERKAAMVSNLLVVLCGSKDAQPVVNSGSLY